MQLTRGSRQILLFLPRDQHSHTRQVQDPLHVDASRSAGDAGFRLRRARFGRNERLRGGQEVHVHGAVHYRHFAPLCSPGRASPPASRCFCRLKASRLHCILEGRCLRVGVDNLIDHVLSLSPTFAYFCLDIHVHLLFHANLL